MLLDAAKATGDVFGDQFATLAKIGDFSATKYELR